MIKNIYKDHKYTHKYYCDYCFNEIKDGAVFRNDEMIKLEYFDLCVNCKKVYDEVYDDTKE